MLWPMIPLTFDAAIFHEFTSCAHLQFDVVDSCLAAVSTHFVGHCLFIRAHNMSDNLSSAFVVRNLHAREALYECHSSNSKVYMKRLKKPSPQKRSPSKLTYLRRNWYVACGVSKAPPADKNKHITYNLEN
jgi:hypothetical protein